MIKFTVFEVILVFHTTRASNIGSNFSSSQLQHRQASKQNSSSHHRQCGLPTRTTRSLSPARHEPPFGALCTTSPSSCLSSSFLADTHAHYFLQHRNIFQLECSPFIPTTPLSLHSLSCQVRLVFVLRGVIHHPPPLPSYHPKQVSTTC